MARVNLIGGVNNVGKTAILEAIYFLLQSDDTDKLTLLPSLFRAPSGVDDTRYFWRWLTNTKASKDDTLIAANIQGVGSVTVEWSTVNKQQRPFGVGGRFLRLQPFTNLEKQRWPIPVVFSPGHTSPVEDAQVYVKAAKRANNEKGIENMLSEIEPRLKRIRVYPDEQTRQPLLHVDLGENEALPASQLGQGFNRLLRIYSSLLSAEAEVFLIDEVETGLHHSVLPTIWKGLASVALQEKFRFSRPPIAVKQSLQRIGSFPPSRNMTSLSTASNAALRAKCKPLPTIRRP